MAISVNSLLVDTSDFNTSNTEYSTGLTLSSPSNSGIVVIIANTNVVSSAQISAPPYVTYGNEALRCLARSDYYLGQLSTDQPMHISAWGLKTDEDDTLRVGGFYRLTSGCSHIVVAQIDDDCPTSWSEHGYRPPNRLSYPFENGMSGLAIDGNDNVACTAEWRGPARRHRFQFNIA